MIKTMGPQVAPRTTTLRILVVDDQTLFRDTLAGMLAGEPSFEVVGIAVDGQDAVRQARAARPDIVLMDIGLPRMDGLVATRRIKEFDPAIKVIALTAYPGDEAFRRALAAGVDSFVLKDSTLEDLTAVIRLTHRGSRLFNGKLLGSWTAGLGRTRGSNGLTEREVEIMELLASGRANRSIAKEFGLSEKTVRNHVSNIYAKLGVTGRAQAVLFAVRNGMVQSSSETAVGGGRRL